MRNLNVRRSILATAMGCLLTVLSFGVCAQDKQKTQGQPAMDPQEAMKKYQEASTPGAGHRALDHYVGSWDIAVKMWWEGPDKPPAETTGTAEVKWILGGRYLQENLTCQMMGQTLQGIGTTGYDNLKKKYVTSFIDNMSTALITSEGTVDASGKVLTSYGKMDDAVTGERDKAVKYVSRIISKDKHVFEIYDLAGTPKEFKAMEMTYTRKNLTSKK